MSEEVNLDAYFERIGFSGSIAPNVGTLETLHGLHVASIPFENLDSLMGLPVRLQLSDVEQKLIFERRGGYCFEQNLLFQAVLETLGFSVKAVGARVMWGRTSDAPAPLSHMALLVEVNGASMLADVGFGGQTLTGPIKFSADIEQQTPNERFRLGQQGPEWQLDIEIGGAWQALYSFDVTGRTAEDFRQMNDLAAQIFRNRLMVSRSEAGKRVALRNNRLNIHTKGQETETRLAGSLIELRDILTNVFGIQLPTTDRLDPALEIALRPQETG